MGTRKPEIQHNDQGMKFPGSSLCSCPHEQAFYVNPKFLIRDVSIKNMKIIDYMMYVTTL